MRPAARPGRPGASLSVRWPNTTTALCTPEQLGHSIASWVLEGDPDPAELAVLHCCCLHLAVASLLARLAGVETIRGCINQASRLRAAAHTSASGHQSPGAP